MTGDEIFDKAVEEAEKIRAAFLPASKSAIELIPFAYVPNPQAYCSSEAYAFLMKMIWDHALLLAVTEAAKEHKLLDDLRYEIPPGQFHEWEALEAAWDRLGAALKAWEARK